MKRSVAFWALLWGAIQLSGCVPGAARSGSAAVDGERPYVIVKGKRYLSQPYGTGADIRRVVAIIRTSSQAERLSARGFNLSNASPYAFILVYSYHFPAACGGYRFRYYQGSGVRILEYDDRVSADHTVKIRDYLTGPGPFIGAGVWGPLDSTSDSPLILLSGKSDQGGMGLMSGSYQIGWVTTLSHDDQKRLGGEYAAAVRRAGACAAAVSEPPA